MTPRRPQANGKVLQKVLHLDFVCVLSYTLSFCHTCSYSSFYRESSSSHLSKSYSAPPCTSQLWCPTGSLVKPHGTLPFPCDSRILLEHLCWSPGNKLIASHPFLEHNLVNSDGGCHSPLVWPRVQQKPAGNVLLQSIQINWGWLSDLHSCVGAELGKGRRLWHTECKEALERPWSLSWKCLPRVPPPALPQSWHWWVDREKPGGLSWPGVCWAFFVRTA